MTPGETERLRRAWEGAPRDPDLVRDLGYDLAGWEVVETQGGGEDRLVFIPSDEDLLHDAEFIVVHPDAVCDLAEKT